MRKDLVSQDDVQPLPPQQITPQLKDLALQFELAAAWCSYPSGKKGEGHITAWACRDVLDAPGAAELFDQIFGREEVDRRAREFDSGNSQDPFVLLDASLSKQKVQALKGLMDSLLP